MNSTKLVEEEFRLAITLPKMELTARREAAAAHVAFAGHCARFAAAEARYDTGKDLDGLDEALRIFEAISVAPAWSACSAHWQADLGQRVSAIYRERYEIGGDERDLRRAISAAEAAVMAAARATALVGDLEQAAAAVKELAESNAGPEQTAANWETMRPLLPAAHADICAQVAASEASALNALGENLSAAFNRRVDREVIDRAVDAHRRAWTIRPSSRIGLHLGSALLLRFKTYGNRDDADAAVAATRSATEFAENPTERGQALDALGCVLIARSEISGGDDLADAVASLEEAIKLVPDFPWFRANLSTALGARFDQFGDRTDLARAAALLDAVLTEIPPTAPDRARLEQNAVAIRYKLNGSAGIEAGRTLLTATPETARSQPARLGALAAALLQEGENAQSLETLNKAIETFRQAIDKIPHGSVDRPSLLHGLGRALAVRFALLGDDKDLNEALDILRGAVAAAGGSAPELPSIKISLSHAASMRATRSASAEDHDAAKATFADACAAGKELNASEAARAAISWVYWAAAEGAWADAAAAGRQAVVAADHVYRVQVGRSEREASLMATGRVQTDAAIAFLHAGLLDEALVTLERGRAQLVSDALERDRAELGRVRSDLSQAYTAAVAGVLASERSSDGVSSRLAHAVLQDVVAEIQRQPGHEGFLRPIDLAGLTAVATETALIYVASGKFGAMVVGIRPGGAVCGRLLDGLDDYVLIEQLARLQEVQVDTYAFRNALDDIGSWLGKTVWPAVLDVLGTTRRATIIQCGLMTLLPLQVAWFADASVSRGRGYIIDELELNFTPNARLLDACRRLATRTSAKSALTVCAPEHTGMAPLVYGARESAAVRAAFQSGELIPGPAATRDAVLKALLRHDILHFACHGRVRPDAPLESALLLAGNDALTVRDLLEQRLPGARLAVLSACETSVVGMRLIDEAVGLPTGFLQAGAAGVIATSWQVEDESSALLVRRFFTEWSGENPAAALRAAQQWLRDSSNGEKYRAYPDLARAPKPELNAEELEDWQTGHDHADIYHWGGFVHAGA